MSKLKKIKKEKITAVLDRFEGDKAVLVFSDGQKLVVDRNLLNFACHEGDLVRLNFSLDILASKSKQNFSKRIISDIMKDKSYEI